MNRVSGIDAFQILEESPCKRWSKRREKVKQRDVPGIDAAYLAMDNETGNEVVWNEVLFSERKNFRDQEVSRASVFRIRTLGKTQSRVRQPNTFGAHQSGEIPQILDGHEVRKASRKSAYLSLNRQYDFR